MRIGLRFTKDIANYMSLGLNATGNVLNGAAQITVHCWASPNVVNASTLANRIFGNNINGTSAPGITVGLAGTTPSVVSFNVSGRSVTGDSTSTVSASGQIKYYVKCGMWNSLAAIFDYVNKTVNLYINGNLYFTTSSIGWANAAYTQGTATGNTDAIGCNAGSPTNTDVQFDGSVSDLAFWKVALGPRDLKRLASGTPPNLIQRPLAMYFKLNGDGTPRCSAGSGVTGTVTGTVLPSQGVSNGNAVRYRVVSNVSGTYVRYATPAPPFQLGANKSFTLCAWISRVQLGSTTPYIFNMGTGITTATTALRAFFSSDTLNIVASNGTSTTTHTWGSSTPYNETHFMAMGYDDDTGKLFLRVDNAVETTLDSVLPQTLSAPFYLFNSAATTNSLVGAMDSVAIRVGTDRLSTSEIDELYGLGSDAAWSSISGALQARLTGFYECSNPASAAVLKDSTANANHLDISGTASVYPDMYFKV